MKQKTRIRDLKSRCIKLNDALDNTENSEDERKNINARIAAIQEEITRLLKDNNDN